MTEPEEFNCLDIPCNSRPSYTKWECPGCGLDPSEERPLDGGSAACFRAPCKVRLFHWCVYKKKCVEGDIHHC